MEQEKTKECEEIDNTSTLATVYSHIASTVSLPALDKVGLSEALARQSVQPQSQLMSPTTTC